MLNTDLTVRTTTVKQRNMNITFPWCFADMYCTKALPTFPELPVTITTGFDILSLFQHFTKKTRKQCNCKMLECGRLSCSLEMSTGNLLQLQINLENRWRVDGRWPVFVQSFYQAHSWWRMYGNQLVNCNAYEGYLCDSQWYSMCLNVSLKGQFKTLSACQLSMLILQSNSL